MLSHSPQQPANDGLIVIRCNCPDLRTSLLAQVIADRMRMECRILPLNNNTPSSELICLFDCQHNSISQLRDWFRKQLNQPDTPLCALINVPAGSSYERLIEWPNVKGIFNPPLSEDKLLRGINHILTGDFWLPRPLLHRFLDENRKPPIGTQQLPHLTRREKQILMLICESASNATIASALHVSEHTVKSHLYNLYKKLDVKSRLQACNWAREVLTLEHL